MEGELCRTEQVFAASSFIVGNRQDGQNCDRILPLLLWVMMEEKAVVGRLLER